MKIEEVIEKMGPTRKILDIINKNDNEVFSSSEISKMVGNPRTSTASLLSSLASQEKISSYKVNANRAFYGTKKGIEKLKKKLEETK